MLFYNQIFHNSGLTFPLLNGTAILHLVYIFTVHIVLVQESSYIYKNLSQEVKIPCMNINFYQSSCKVKDYR